MKRIIRLFREQKGVSLIEALCALVILAAIGVSYLSAMTTAQKNVGLVGEKIEAEGLARSQLDAIRASGYADSYPLINNIPGQYVVEIRVDNITPEPNTDPNSLQLVTVTISRPVGGGAEDRPVLAVSTYKAKE